MKFTAQLINCMMQWSSLCCNRASYVEQCMKLKELRAAILPNSFFDDSPGLMQCVNSIGKDGMMLSIAWVLSILTLVHAMPSTHVHVLLLLDAMMHAFLCC